MTDPGVSLTASSHRFVEQALRALRRGRDHTANAVIAPGNPREPVSRRFARAAAGWSGLTGGAVPSYERQAQLLGSVCEAGDALRVAVERCASAREALACPDDRDVRPRPHRNARVSAACSVVMANVIVQVARPGAS
jgi:hypothetical protein